MYPSPEQYAALKTRDDLELLEPPRAIQAQDGTIKLGFDLPTHAISLLLIEED